MPPQACWCLLLMTPFCLVMAMAGALGWGRGGSPSSQGGLTCFCISTYEWHGCCQPSWAEAKNTLLGKLVVHVSVVLTTTRSSSAISPSTLLVVDSNRMGVCPGTCLPDGYGQCVVAACALEKGGILAPCLVHGHGAHISPTVFSMWIAIEHE